MLNYFGYPTVNTEQVISDASNIRTGENPAYLTSDFLSVYPQFGDDAIISTDIIQLYIDLANACIKEARWHKSWKIAMGLFVAHWCTLWLRSTASASDGKDAIIQAGQTQGIITTESVDGVSYSMDINAALSDLQGYGAWKTTDYGVQLATLAKIYGKGMMLIW
jgi:hypothetical protein